MRVNTIWSGILSTNLSSVESTNRLTRMLVPNPKKAFQSPGVHSFGLLSVVIALPLRQDGHTARVSAHASELFRSVFEMFAVMRSVESARITTQRSTRIARALT